MMPKFGSSDAVPPEFIYRIPESHHFNGRVNQYLNLRIPELIEEQVSQSNWKYLLEGQFGPILKMCNKISFSSKLVHYMLLREVKTAKRKEMWFKLQNRAARFSIKEFALVTGLNCGETKELPPIDKRIVTKFFGKKISIADLESIFVKTPPHTTLKLKLAMLLILEGMLLGSSKQKNVRPLGVHMMQDVDTFNSFPWGRIVYEDTIDSLREGIPHLGNNEPPKDDNYGYHLNGFPWALQVWIYEAMPEMGNKFAKVVPNMKNATPRCLRWSSSKNVDYTDIVTSFSEKNDDNCIKVNPKVLLVEEENESLSAHVCFDDENIDKKVDAYVNILELAYKERKSEKNVSPAVEKMNSTAIQSDNFSDRLSAIEVDTRQMKVVLDSLTSCVQAIMHKLGIPTPKPSAGEEDYGLPIIQLEETQLKETDLVKINDVPPVMPCLAQQEENVQIMENEFLPQLQDAVPPMIVHTEDSHPTMTLKPKQEKRILPNRGKKRDFTSQFVTPTKKKHKVEKKTEKPWLHTNAEDVKPLHEWLEETSCTSITSLIGLVMNKAFFEDLAQKGFWLGTKELEEALCLMRKRVHDFPNKCRKVVILDTFWSIYIKRLWDAWSSDIKNQALLNNYIIGKAPRLYPKSWVEADTILCPFNILDKHWVALQIELSSGTINIFDSDITLYDEDFIYQQLLPIRDVLPILLSSCSAIAGKYVEQFACHRIKDLPRSVRVGDCGAYTMKYIDALSLGVNGDLSFINDEYIEEYRGKVAADIFNFNRPGI